MRITYYFSFLPLSVSLHTFFFNFFCVIFKKAEKLRRFKMSPEFFFKCIQNSVAFFIVLLYLKEIRNHTSQH